MRHVFILLLTSLSLVSLGQEAGSKKFSIRSGLIFEYSTSNSSVYPTVIGFSKYNSKNNQHIVELQQLRFSKTPWEKSNGWTTIKGTDIQLELVLSYQYEHFVNSLEKRVRPYIGYSAEVGFLRVAEEPFTSLSYPSAELHITPAIKFNLGMNLNITQSLYIDFWSPIDLLQYKFVSKHINNPNITENSRRKHTDEVNFLPFDYFQLRLTAGLRF